MCRPQGGEAAEAAWGSTDVASGHLGLPVPGVEAKLVRDETTGGKTEIRFRGPNVMPGYWRAPEQTRAAFDEEGYYRTGDAVRWLDAADPQRGLFFDGRTAEVSSAGQVPRKPENAANYQ